MNGFPKVCVYTAIFDGYDDPKPFPPQTVPTDAFCITDDPGFVAAPPWRAVFADPGVLPAVPAKLRSRYFKVLPHRALELIRSRLPDATADYEHAIWIDGSVRTLRDGFVERMIAAARVSGIAAFRHPDRDCIYDEIEAALGLGTVTPGDAERMRVQVAHYRALGFPAHAGLFACGILARALDDAAVERTGEAWWREITTWAPRDQLSFPYVLWQLGARCEAIDLDLWRNPLFEVMPHLPAEAGGLLRGARSEYSAVPFVATERGHAVGAFVPERGYWRLPASDGGRFDEFPFGPTDRPMVPIVGDWNGDGSESPGVYDPATGTFFLRHARSAGDADLTFGFGPAGGVPVAGDWDGTGHDRVGVFVREHGCWFLAKRNAPGGDALQLSFGAPGTHFVPVAGDWDGRGSDRPGLYDAAASRFILLDENRTGAGTHSFDFGPNRGVPVVGDWNGDGADEVGVCVREQGQAFLAHRNVGGSACSRVLVDPPGAWPLALRRAALR